MLKLIIGIIAAICIITDKKRKKAASPEKSAVTPAPRPPRKKLSASAVTLLIGTAFIVLSAITFVAANWVNMNDAGKVSALLVGAGLAFGISFLLKKAVKLTRTSIAFYMIGTIVAVIDFITAGYYGFFGDWFSVGGNGACALYASASLAAAAASFAAKPIYESNTFYYTGASFVSLAIYALCGLPFDSYEGFVVTVSLTQLVLTAVIRFAKPQKGTEMERPIEAAGGVSAFLYQITACVYIADNTLAPTAETFLLLGVIMVQLLVYGILYKKTGLLVLFNIVGLYTGIVLAFYNDSPLLFAFITSAFFIANRIIPKTPVPCRVITLAATIIGSIVSFSSHNEQNCVLCLVVPLIASLGVTSYSLYPNKSVQEAVGLFSPIMPFFTAVFLNHIIESYTPVKETESAVIAFGLLALVYTALSALFVILPKLKKLPPLSSQLIIYTNMGAAALVLLGISRYSQLFMIPVILCLLHFAVSCSMNCNVTAAGSVISLIAIVYSVIDNIITDDSTGMYIMFALFAALVIASRFLFPDGLAIKTEDGKFRIDVILLSSWAAMVPFPISDNYAMFIRKISIALFILGFIKKNTKGTAASALLTASSAIACLAFITRPFLNPSSSMIADKINIAIFALLGVCFKFIWRNHPTASKRASTAVFIIAFASLIIDGIAFDSVANKIFVLAVIIGVLALSFFAKLGTWFTASSAALVIMTLASTYKYINSAGWWLYLLIAGIILIVISSVNELCRKNNENIKSAAVKKFSGWKW